MGFSRREYWSGLPFPSPGELLRVPLRSQGYCAVGRGRSELHWVWCSRRGPYLEGRQEPQGSSPFLIPIAAPCIVGEVSQASSCVQEWTSACLSSCSLGDRHLLSCKSNLRSFPDDARGCQCPFVLCLDPQGCLRRGVRASGPSQERTGESGAFGMWHPPNTHTRNRETGQSLQEGVSKTSCGGGGLEAGLLSHTWMQSQKPQNDLCSFPRQTIQYQSNPSLCPNQ